MFLPTAAGLVVSVETVFCNCPAGQFPLKVFISYGLTNLAGEVVLKVG